MKLKIKKNLNTRFGVNCSFKIKIIYDNTDACYVAKMKMKLSDRPHHSSNLVFGNGSNIDEAVEDLMKKLPFWKSGVA